MAPERWRPVRGYEDLYEVSDLGNVRSLNFHSTGMTRALRVQRYKYASVKLANRGQISRRLIHRLVAEAFLGPCAVGHQVNHRDGNKHNNAATNLEYCTASENRRHAFSTGLQSHHGESHNNSKLTDSDVVGIRARAAAGEHHSVIAHDFGVHKSTVSDLARGKRWPHIPFAGEGRVFH